MNARSTPNPAFVVFFLGGGALLMAKRAYEDEQQRVLQPGKPRHEAPVAKLAQRRLGHHSGFGSACPVFPPQIWGSLGVSQKQGQSQLGGPLLGRSTPFYTTEVSQILREVKGRCGESFKKEIMTFLFIWQV